MYHAIVMGGGPAGATVATRLGQLGRNVLVIERSGCRGFTSASRCSRARCRCSKSSVSPVLWHSGFAQTRRGVRDRRWLAHASLSVRRGVVDGPASAYEVDRAEFDKLLLDNAALRGAEVRQGLEVKSFSIREGSGVEVVARDESGGEQRFEGRVLIDATGQRAYLGSKLGLKSMDPELKNFAVFSHYEGAERHSGDREGDISIVLVDDGWWWVIPLRGDRTSVGLVAPARCLRGHRPDQAYFESRIENTPYLARRLAKARRVADVRTASDYSYKCRRKVGDHWLLVGDAAAFIDPVFSTGVYLGMSSAFRAAEAVDRALTRRSYRARDFADYERFVTRAVGSYSEFVKGFYTPEFAEVMMHPSDKLQLRQAVTSLLAGHGFDNFAVSWRIAIFRGITHANRRFNLTPRLPGRREAAALL